MIFFLSNLEHTKCRNKFRRRPNYSTTRSEANCQISSISRKQQTDIRKYRKRRTAPSTCRPKWREKTEQQPDREHLSKLVLLPLCVRQGCQQVYNSSFELLQNSLSMNIFVGFIIAKSFN